jgi:nucleotide-binding universal stress UspA family protein
MEGLMDTSNAGRVFVGVSGSLAGLQAVRHAAAEARRRDGVMYAVRAYRCSPAARRDAVLDTAAADIARVFLQAFGGMPPGVTVKLVLDEGAPGAVLTAAADRADDLIVIGGAGPRRLFGRRHAAIVRRCSRDAACPVVMVPPPELVRRHRPGRLAHDVAADARAFLRGAPVQPLGIRP